MCKVAMIVGFRQAHSLKHTEAFGRTSYRLKGIWLCSNNVWCLLQKKVLVELKGQQTAITGLRPHTEPKQSEFLAQPHLILKCLTRSRFTDLRHRQTDGVVLHSRGCCRQSTGVYYLLINITLKEQFVISGISSCPPQSQMYSSFISVSSVQISITCYPSLAQRLEAGGNCQTSLIKTPKLSDLHVFIYVKLLLKPKKHVFTFLQSDSGRGNKRDLQKCWTIVFK